MWLIKGVFVGKKNFDVIKMYGTAIKKTHRPLPGINMNGSQTTFKIICLRRMFEAWYRGTLLEIKHRAVRKQASHINKYRLFELPYEANTNIILTRCNEHH